MGVNQFQRWREFFQMQEDKHEQRARRAMARANQEDDLIDRIEEVRRQNNRQWMALLRLALEAEPQQAKAILLKIKQHDSEIQRLLGELASD